MSETIYPEFTTQEFRARVNKCIHCGLCLQACPTYAVFGTEMDSPRGRIVLIRAVSEGKIAPADFNTVFARHMDLCLSCLACETACPSGVQYGQLAQTAKTALAARRTPGLRERFIRWLGLQQVMPELARLKLIARALWVYQASGLQRVIRALNLLPKPLRSMEAILPPLDLKFLDRARPAPAIGASRGTVAFFHGCIQEAFLASANASTVRVLQRNGYTVHFPAKQTCCGAAHLHVGDVAHAQQLARQNLDALLDDRYDAVINNAGGCGATLKHEYAHLFDDEPAYAEKAKRLAHKVKDISEFLIDHLNTPPRGQVNLRVTYSDSCHLRHAQKVIKPPRDLIKMIPGIELVELKSPDRCCGSAGVYNLAQAETADAILDAKMADVAATGAEVIVASNTGCQMQLWAGVRRAKLNARVMHVAELVDLSYRAMDQKI